MFLQASKRLRTLYTQRYTSAKALPGWYLQKRDPNQKKNHTNFLEKIEVELLKAGLSYLPALTTSLAK